MTARYPYGYGRPPAQLTAAELEQRTNWRNLHPEFRRRLVAMFDAAAAQGRVLGLGGGWRSTASQEQVFFARHEQVRIGGCCLHNGKRWKLRKGMAHAAPPGRSWHEGHPDFGNLALAADLIGDTNWSMANCHLYGLRHFGPPSTLKEPWHYQPLEVPPARSQYRGEKLTVWQLPEPRRTLKLGDTGDDVKMAQHIMATKAGQPITVDGKFGPQTEAGVVNVQRFFQLPVTKQIDPATWAVLDMLAKQ